jgi:ABC-type multidrug transport system fused ATPase/permease subunit
MNIPLKPYWNLLARYIEPQKGRFLSLAVLLLSGIGLQLANPQIMRHFIDTAQSGGTAESLLRTALLFIAVALAQQVLSLLATCASENVAWTATNALRADLADHCLRLDMSFHNAHTPGEMIERLDGDVTVLSNFFSQFLIQVMGNALLLAGVLVLLFGEDWRVGLALTGFTLITLFALRRLGNIAVPHWAAERQASADLFGFLEERLSGTEDIRASGAEAYVMRHFYRLMHQLMKRSLKAALMINVLLNTSFLLFALGNVTAFAVGAWLFQEGVLTIGTVYIIFHYTRMLERPIEQIARQLGDLQKAGAGIVRIQELLNTQSKIREADVSGLVGSALPEGALAVEFQDVSFGYDDAVLSSGASSDGNGKDIVLHDLSFRLPPGRVLGLLGRTGSGKTTLTRLLFRLYDPDNGAIRLGDGASLLDVHRVRLPDLRQRVGMVTQNIQLFHATVRDNLTFFDDSIPDERVLQVIHELGLGEWIQSLPDGLDTELASSGGGLSAGEAQLLAFARIFLQDPGLLVLDEASSRLDPATEHLIERAVDKLVQNRTAIIVAHRLGTVQRADEIMILEGGCIAEYGARTQLACDPNSRFYSLLRTGLEEMLV